MTIATDVLGIFTRSSLPPLHSTAFMASPPLIAARHASSMRPVLTLRPVSRTGSLLSTRSLSMTHRPMSTSMSHTGLQSMHMHHMLARKPWLPGFIHRPLGLANLHTSRPLLDQRPGRKEETDRAIYGTLDALEQLSPDDRKALACFVLTNSIPDGRELFKEGETWRRHVAGASKDSPNFTRPSKRATDDTDGEGEVGFFGVIAVVIACAIMGSMTIFCLAAQFQVVGSMCYDLFQDWQKKRAVSERERDHKREKDLEGELAVLKVKNRLGHGA